MDTSKLTVTYLDHMGDDKMVVNAARASFNKADKGPINSKDVGLLNFLARGYTEKEWGDIADELYNGPQNWNRIQELMWELRTKSTHFAPFTHPQLSVRITAPLAIARQMWKSHIGVVGGDTGYAAWSEESRRYVDASPDMFVPTMRRRANNVKQGSSNEVVEDANIFLVSGYNHSKQQYESLLNKDVAPELARLVLPAGTMVTWVWTGSLMFFARVFWLRSDSHAQQESQQLAEQINDILITLFPVSFTALRTGNAQLPDWWVNKVITKLDLAIEKLFTWGV